MSKREDIQFIPNLGRLRDPTALGQKAEAKQLAQLEKRTGGMMDMLTKRVRVMKGIKRMRRHRQMTRGVRMARMGSGLRVAAGRMAARTPWGLVAAAVAAVVTVGIKVKYGKTFGQLGAELNRLTLGDADDAARASSMTRQQVMNNPYVRLETAASGSTEYANQMFTNLYPDNLQREKGRSLFEEEFGVSNTWDMLIDQGVAKFKEAFRGAGGHESINQLTRNLENKQ